MDFNNLTISQAHHGIIKKHFSIKELVSYFLEKIKKEDLKINSFINLNENILKEAEKLQTKLNSDSHFLYGIPLAIKDNILIENLKCTAGSKILENYQAVYDATVIKKLKKAGALFIGKTNLDEFAMGSSTENSAFGPTKNPYDLNRVPGGSSGGSAAAVAANFCLGALGSDTGGSIRQPSAFCGVVGLKPTYGRVSRYGLIAMASSLDQIGPIAKTVDDVAIILQTIEGKDNFDSTSTDPLFKIEFPVKEKSEFSIGLPEEYFSKGVDEKIIKKIQEIIKQLEKNGGKIKKIKLPNSDYALSAYYLIMPSEVSSNLARYDGIKYGLSQNGQNVIEINLQSRSQGLGQEVKRRIILGTFALSAGYYKAYFKQASKARTLIINDFKNAFKEVDLILTPVSPSLPFKLGEKIDDPLKMYLSDIFTVPINLAGLPAISIPIGFTKVENKKLPIGLQIIGNYFEENKILKLAKFIEKLQ